jgi:hypothetical protein
LTPPHTGASTSRLLAFWDEPSFAIGAVEFLSIDVAIAAMARGDWSAFERGLTEGLACAAHADASGSGPTADAIDAAGTAFRYDRDLISATEMNEWLDGLGLSLEEWSTYLKRTLLRRELRDAVEDVLDSYQPSAAALIQASFVEGVCSGSFHSFAEKFAGRAALIGDLLARTASGSEPSPASDAAAHQLVHAHAHWLSSRPAGDAVARARRILAIESAYNAAVVHLLGEASLPEIVHRHRMDWRLIETDTVVFSTEHAAREAILCIRDEQLSLQHVASLARRTAERRCRFADTIDAADRMLTADPGSLMGPEAVDDGFEVTRLVGCTWPSLDDPRIAERARAAAVEAAVQEAVRERVTRRAGG